MNRTEARTQWETRGIEKHNRTAAILNRGSFICRTSQKK